MEPHLGEVKRIEAIFRPRLLRHNLDKQSPAGEVFFLNAFVQVTLVAFSIFGYDRTGFLVAQIFDTLLGFEVELDPVPFILRVDKTKRCGCQNRACGDRNRECLGRS